MEIEDHRISNSKFLLKALEHPSSRVVRTALLAMGRIGDPFFIQSLEKFLGHSRPEWRKLAGFSLGLIGGKIALDFLLSHFEIEQVDDVRKELLVSIGRAGNENTVSFLGSILKNQVNEMLLSGAAHGLGILWSGDSSSWVVPPLLLSRLVELAASNTPVSLYAVFALSRFKGDGALLPVDQLILALQRVQDPAVLSLLCRVLGKQKNSIGAVALAALLANSSSNSVKIEAAKALAKQEPSQTVVEAIGFSIQYSENAVVVSSLETASVFGLAADSLAETVLQLVKNSKSDWVKREALKALSKIRPETAKSYVYEILKAPLGPFTVTAVSSLSNLGAPSDLVELFQFLNHADVQMAQAALSSLASLRPEQITDLVQKKLGSVLTRKDVGLISVAADIIAQFKLRDLAAGLSSAYSLLERPDDIEGKISVLNSLSVVGGVDQVPLIEGALLDPNKFVVESAVKSIKAITGRDESDRIPLNSKVDSITPNWSQIIPALVSTVIFRTTRGEIHVQMSDLAPLTVVNFIRLVKNRFYDGKTFHRVVPNFVSQGGDPRGDGYGGPGYLIRDEVSPVHHFRGTVGMATAGKDTGGCQFFFNQAPNLHLEGRYTLFASITKGLDVLDRLEQGDKIIETILSSRPN